MGFGLLGITMSLSFAAMGSALGAGAAGMAAIGAWKRCYIHSKQAPFLLIAFVGAPLSQTLYGYILMNTVLVPQIGNISEWLMLGIGLFGGISIGMSAWFQGKTAAAAADALAETGKGFAQYITVLGILETIALFVMVFLLFVVGIIG